MSRRKLRTIAEDAIVLPWVVADTVIEQAESVLASNLSHDILRTYLVDHAELAYQKNKDWAAKIRSYKGRDILYAYMQHWLAGWLRNNEPSLFRLLPIEFSTGTYVRRESRVSGLSGRKPKRKSGRRSGRR